MKWPVIRLIGSWSLAHFGYRAALIAMPLLALQQTGSAWAVGLVSGAGGIPVITAPWWTGSLQRRLRSASALAALLAAQGLATLLVPISATFQALTPTVMIGAGLLVGLFNALSGPLNASLVAEAGDRIESRSPGRLGRQCGNGAARLLAVQDTAVKVSMTAAPLLALPAITIVGATWTVALEGLLSLAAAALTMTLRLSSHPSGAGERPRVLPLLRRHHEIAVGWAVRGVGCAAWFAFTLGLTLLGQAQGHGVLLAAVGLTAYSAGAVIGSSLGIVTASSTRPGLVNSLSWLIAGTGWLAMCIAPDAVVVGVAATVMGLAVPAGNAATMAMVTRSFSGLERRAVLTAQTTVVTGASAMGMLLGGPLIALADPRAAIGLAGLVVTVAAAVGAVSEYGRSRDRRSVRGTSSSQKVSHDREPGHDRELSRLQRR